MQFDLNEIVNNTEKALEVKNKIEAGFKELTESAALSLQTAKDTKVLNDQLHEQVQELTKASINLNQAMRDIHTMLNSKRELFREDPEMVAFVESLGKYILSSGSIKLHVMGNSDGK